MCWRDGGLGNQGGDDCSLSLCKVGSSVWRCSMVKGKKEGGNENYPSGRLKALGRL